MQKDGSNGGIKEKGGSSTRLLQQEGRQAGETRRKRDECRTVLRARL